MESHIYEERTDGRAVSKKETYINKTHNRSESTNGLRDFQRPPDKARLRHLISVNPPRVHSLARTYLQA